MNDVLAFASAALMSVMAWVSVRERRIVSVYWVSALLLGGIPLLFARSVKFADLGNYYAAEDSITRCITFVLLFNILVAIAYKCSDAVRRISDFDKIAEELRNKRHKIDRMANGLTLAVMVAAVAFIGVNVHSLDGLMSFSWTDVAENVGSGESQYLYITLASAYYALSAALPLSVLAKKHINTVAGVLFCFAVALILGGRTFLVGPLVGALLAGVFCLETNRRRYIGRISRSAPSRLPFALAGIVSIYIVFTFIAWFRSNSSVTLFAEQPMAELRQFWEQFDPQPDPSAGALLYVFDSFPRAMATTDGLTYKEMLLLPIPGKLVAALPFKVEKTYRSVANELALEAYGTEGHSRFGSIHSTIWGDAFANFGWGGLSVAPIWGLIFASLERRLRRSSLLTVLSLPTIGASLFLFVRGSMLHAELYLLVPLLGCLLLEAVLKRGWERVTRKDAVSPDYISRKQLVTTRPR